MAAANEKCACSGIRKCLLCEGESIVKKISHKAADEEHSKSIQQYKFCIFCGGTLPAGQSCTHAKDVKADTIKLEGVTVIPDFVNETEEQTIVTEIDKTIWKPSQSGRRKQVE